MITDMEFKYGKNRGGDKKMTDILEILIEPNSLWEELRPREGK